MPQFMSTVLLLEIHTLPIMSVDIFHHISGSVYPLVKWVTDVETIKHMLHHSNEWRKNKAYIIGKKFFIDIESSNPSHVM